MSVQAVASPVADATTHVRAELSRVDAKAGMLLTLSGTALTVLLALLARTRLPLAAVATGWFTAAVVAAAVVALALAIRPRLAGSHGFVRYARSNPAAVRDEFRRLHAGDWNAACENERREVDALVAFSRLAAGKYRRVRLAVDLLLAGLAGVTVTAALAGLL
jgi:hypothetical protein